jgi:hypothetical protein
VVGIAALNALNVGMQFNLLPRKIWVESDQLEINRKEKNRQMKGLAHKKDLYQQVRVVKEYIL